jgi:flagellar basal-body rod protein FlgG
MQALNIGATGMLAQQTNVEVISNNIANMNTTAFKRHRAEFQDLLYQDLRRVGSNSSDAGTIVPLGIQLGVGVRVASTYRVSEQGSLILTDNQLDLAIRGRGMFQIQLPTGEPAYTRSGSFQVNAAGTIVNADGFTVLPGITVDQAAVGVTINQSGQVLVKLDGQVTERRGSDSARDFPERGRPRASGQQPSGRDGSVGRRRHRKPWNGWIWRHLPGLH